MKSVNHQTTLHLSFKIKCCVDRLRPPCSNKKIERDDDSKKSHSALVTIRYAIEHGTARLEWRTRIIHRHCAVSLPDEHAGPDDHRRFVADDDAGIWRRQARSRAVGPEDRVA